MHVPKYQIGAVTLYTCDLVQSMIEIHSDHLLQTGERLLSLLYMRDKVTDFKWCFYVT